VRPSLTVAVTSLVVATLTACSSSDAPATAPSTSAGVTATEVDYAELADQMAPLAASLGWEVQRAYRIDAELLRQDVDLVNVYLRPIGDDPAPDEYVETALAALQLIGSTVFDADPTVTAIDVCLQRPNDAPPDTPVEPAFRILGLRDDLEPLLATDVELTDLVPISQDGRLVLLPDEHVRQAAAWRTALSTAGG
jgi:hypothetical protein